jgi:hypothetical protein
MTDEQLKRIEGLAVFACDVFHNCESLPLLLPKITYLDCMDFDRPICELGVKQYIRPIMETEAPLKDNPEAEAIRQELRRYTHCIVREASPGVRIKSFVKLLRVPETPVTRRR